ncbi:MAG: hypothetical protein ACFE95_09725 [Candidatus Hodarchaeota archaeon]
MVLKQAKSLVKGQWIYDSTLSVNGTPARFKVYGKIKLWKRDPTKIRVPLKRGLREHDYLTENNLNHFFLTEQEAKENQQ